MNAVAAPVLLAILANLAYFPGNPPAKMMRENRQLLPDASSRPEFVLIDERMAKDRALAQGFLALSISGALAGAVLAAAIKSVVATPATRTLDGATSVTLAQWASATFVTDLATGYLRIA